jgi:hypothetical protein
LDLSTYIENLWIQFFAPDVFAWSRVVLGIGHSGVDGGGGVGNVLDGRWAWHDILARFIMPFIGSVGIVTMDHLFDCRLHSLLLFR